MTWQDKSWERNTEGLRKSSQDKADATKKRVEEALRLLVKELRVINFKTVAETAHVSTAWLYGSEDIKTRIIHLRSQQVPRAQVRIPPREQASNASKDVVIAALQKRVTKQADEIKMLKEILEVISGQLQEQYLKS